MAILINKNTKVITQGMTGKVGQFHTLHCKNYANGINCFVAGVTPGKGGQEFLAAHRATVAARPSAIVVVSVFLRRWQEWLWLAWIGCFLRTGYLIPVKAIPRTKFR